MTSCLKPTPEEKLYPLTGIAPPHIRRKIASEIERVKQTSNERHPMYGIHNETFHLKSRKSFVKYTTNLENNPQTARIKLWKEESKQQVEEKLPPGHNNKWTA